jgi:anti-sigma factor RsiW
MNAEKQGLAELAPFYVAGTLKADEKAEFEGALPGDPELARNVAAARAERDAIVALNEALPGPSPRATEFLSALLDAEPARTPNFWRRLDPGARLADLLGPRTLGWIALAACLLVAVEAGLLVRSAPAPEGPYATASRDEAAPEGRFALVAFAPDATAARIVEFLAQNEARIVEGPRAGGFFRIKLGDKDMSEAQAAARLDALRASGLFRFAQKVGDR